MNNLVMRTEKWLKLLGLLGAVLLLALLAACGSSDTATTEKPQDEQQQTTDNSGTSQKDDGQPAATQYPLTVTDDSGVTITLEKAPERIVTLAPSETEAIFAVGAGDRVVGVDSNSNYPEQVASIEKIGDMTVDVEKVAALKPDLILASVTMNGQAIEQLRQLKLNVYASEPKTYAAVMDKMTQIGVLTDTQKQTAEVVAHMQQVKDEVEAKVKNADKPSVFLEFSPGYTVGKGEFLDELLTIAGGHNVATGNGWYEFDAEQIITSNPSVIIYPSWFEEPNAILEGIKARPAWKEIDAVKNNRLVEVANDPLVRVGPRLSEGLMDLAKAIHPDLFQ
ncbi:ABC transporter substrate-binding protein [Paenibacillus xylaniclasticus]|uniref:ABC transporter substrate-binding protein n=1 Tax=Paenibacillus xylaniclasticus TaxID=588083 RepID=UPI000FDA0CFF|nr:MULTISPECIES: ABC transporter substrate-binding protein [Paenibacillus]GFN31798.1 putative ABC transporter substrate-binding lipoprotein YvrC [Paenibacillus curdlanolyticus]